MSSFRAVISCAVAVCGTLWAHRCQAAPFDEDTWFNGTSSAPIALPSASPVGGGRIYTYTIPAAERRPSPEELDQQDMHEASQDYEDKGDKYFRQGDWVKAIAYYEEALKYDGENDYANDSLKKAKARLLAQQQEEAREENERRIEAERLYIANRDKSIEGDRQYLNDQLERLMVEADHIYVPPPPEPRHIHEGLILGLFEPQDEAESTFAGAASPFTGKPYAEDEVFATADSKTASEGLRGFLDNQTIGAYTLDSAHGRQLIASLQGTEFDRLIAHSNGATVAEALIDRGVIKVKELDVVGGDRSLVNQSGYQNMIDSGRVQRVVVWINPGDTIPVGSSLAYVTPMGSVNVAPLLTSAEHYANVLTGNHQGGDAKVEYRLLQGPGYAGQTFQLGANIFQPHDLKASYFPNIVAYFKNHGAGGATQAQDH